MTKTDTNSGRFIDRAHELAESVKLSTPAPVDGGMQTAPGDFDIPPPFNGVRPPSLAPVDGGMETTAEERASFDERCRFSAWDEPEVALWLMGLLRDFDRLTALFAALLAAEKERGDAAEEFAEARCETIAALLAAVKYPEDVPPTDGSGEIIEPVDWVVAREARAEQVEAARVKAVEALRLASGRLYWAGSTNSDANKAALIIGWSQQADAALTQGATP